MTVALSYYHQAITIQRRKFFPDALINSLLSVVSLYESTGHFDSAFVYISEALVAAGQQTSPSQRLLVIKSSALHFTQAGNFRKANEFYTRFLKLSDSLEMLNSLNKIEQIQSVYEIISKEKDHKILQQRVNLQQLAIQRQQIVLLVALILFLFLAYFLFSNNRNRKRERTNNEMIANQAETLHQREKEMLIEKEQNLKLEIDYKNRQLTSYALNMARNNEFISRATEQLKQILLGINPREKEKSDRIRQILSELQQYPAGNDWEEFRLCFEEVHQSFEKNLTGSFPSLSANDKKICALLKLGLSTKDIAAITFRELRSVESARNRLRKKLGLATDVNIHTFLSQF
jgi:DNA-binding CsgD family transcriptional regulator